MDETSNHKRYRIGIDVGLNSVGLAAIEVDKHGSPIAILNAVSHFHDGGVDPNESDSKDSRLKTRGVARRLRHRYAHRNERLLRVDDFIQGQGWPLVRLDCEDDPLSAWRVRAALVSGYIEDPYARGQALSIAFRHIARHRGWRNPWTSVSSAIEASSVPSARFVELRQSLPGTVSLPENATTAELVMSAVEIEPGLKLRHGREKNGVLGQHSPLQSDYVAEVRRIVQTQELGDSLFKSLCDVLFFAERPHVPRARIGTDPTTDRELRAPRASVGFQRFRISQAVANLRIRTDDGAQLPLAPEELALARGFLDVAIVRPTWDEVAEHLGIESERLVGTASAFADGQPYSSPPINKTNQAIAADSSAALQEWWSTADEILQDALVTSITDGLADTTTEEQYAGDFLAELVASDEAVLERLQKGLEGGRAKYALTTLRKLNTAMADGIDLHAAQQAVFPEGYQDTPTPIGEPTGSPSVDRVTRHIARWLAAVEKRWGIPLSVNIENTRQGLVGAAEADRIARSSKKWARYRLQKVQEIEAIRGPGRVSDDEINRFLAIERQNGQCLYCESPIKFVNAQMDHIVPRKGAGSTSTRSNLVAVCARCNADKNNQVFSEWAKTCGIPGVSVKAAVDRVHFFNDDGEFRAREVWPGETPLEQGQARRKARDRFHQAIILRLRRTREDDPIDNRSIESVGYMANIVRDRIQGHFGEKVVVGTFQGALTSEAWYASGLAGRVTLGGGKGKNRLDRRHHAVDACIISFMEPGVAKTLAERRLLREDQKATGKAETWKDHGPQGLWGSRMLELAPLIERHLAENRIAVTENLRLRLGNSRVHKAVNSFNGTRLKDGINDETLGRISDAEIQKAVEALPNRTRVDKGRTVQWTCGGTTYSLGAQQVIKLTPWRLGDALSADLIDRAGSPALWSQLTRLEDYDRNTGLPADPQRSIRLNGVTLDAETEISFFPGTVGLAVGDGWAELSKSALHHVRFYRWRESDNNPWEYGMLRVYSPDLLHYQNRDLFSEQCAPIGPSSISRRKSAPGLRKALEHRVEFSCQYLGWMTKGDELELDLVDPSPDTVLANFLSSQVPSRDKRSLDIKHSVVLPTYAELPGITLWRVAGFESESLINLRPRLYAEEGLDDDASRAAKDVLGSRSLRMNVGKLFTKFHPRILRRTVLGHPRMSSVAHLPVTWPVAPNNATDEHPSAGD
ncbi:MAG: HNH endonuclease [Propionibacteriaceae bacterium]|nr:HNH endonuclease [Propionibacteriaceae bacterium]